MKIEDFNKVSDLVCLRTNLLRNIEVVKNSNALGVTINGTYQDEDMLNAVRESVVDEFNRRIIAIDKQLVAYGVVL